MSLAAGTRRGPYEVLGLIGAGGTSEVYEALDTRLDRTVVIRFLPAELSAYPARRTRFEREARAGETLAQRLPRGPLPVAQALELGAQEGSQSCASL